jgi:hypothetical protein
MPADLPVLALTRARVGGGSRRPDPAHLPLEDVRAAFTELEAGHTAGNIVLIP